MHVHVCIFQNILFNSSNDNQCAKYQYFFQNQSYMYIVYYPRLMLGNAIMTYNIHVHVCLILKVLLQ